MIGISYNSDNNDNSNNMNCDKSDNNDDKMKWKMIWIKTILLEVNSKKKTSKI